MSCQPVVYVGYRYTNDTTGVAGWVTPIRNGYGRNSGAPPGIVRGNKMTQLSTPWPTDSHRSTSGSPARAQVCGVSAAGNGARVDLWSPLLTARPTGHQRDGGELSLQLPGGLRGVAGGRECGSELFFALVGPFVGNSTEYGMRVYAGT